MLDLMKSPVGYLRFLLLQLEVKKSPEDKQLNQTIVAVTPPHPLHVHPIPPTFLFSLPASIPLHEF